MDEEFRLIEIGKGEILQDGKDGAILALGTMVYPCMKAAERLASEGISVSVVNARFVKPLDEDLIVCLANEKPYLFTVEEAALMGGFGSAVMELLEERNFETNRVLRIGIPDKLIPHGSPNLLHAKYGIDADGIFERISKFVHEEYSSRPRRSRKNSSKPAHTREE